MAAKHTWAFKARLRSRAFGWRGSHLACQRLKEAVTEIKKIARTDPVIAGDGVVSLVERIWPAFQDIDTSSGALGGAVYWAQGELLPIAIEAPADRKTRDKWLDCLWQAIEDDGVDYLSVVGSRWGELCGSREVASYWADRFLGLLRTAWSDRRPGNYVRGTGVWLYSLLAAGRHQELLEVLALQRFPFWHDRKFGMQALVSEGRTGEALTYAEASRGLNQPDAAIDAACEKLLLDLGRVNEAYEKYGLTASASSTGLATFRAIVKKYPGQDQKKILLDLATASGEPGRWFAAAKDARFLDLALEFVKTSRTDPRTLSRASRDLLKKDARFCLAVGRLAIEGFHPDHAAYVYAQNQVSVMSEQLTALKEMAPFADIISRAEDLYVPSAPPMSPLTKSYFTCWAFFDACAGPANETIGTTILGVGAAFGMYPELLRFIQLMQNSRMGFYIHHGREGNVSVLEDLVTTAVYRAIVPTGYAGRKNENWYVRLLPPPIAGGHGTCRLHHAIHRGPSGLRRLVGILPAYFPRHGWLRRLRAPHEIRANQGMLERLRFRSLREPPGRRDLSRRPSRHSREPPALRNIRGKWLEGLSLHKAELTGAQKRLWTIWNRSGVAKGRRSAIKPHRRSLG